MRILLLLDCYLPSSRSVVTLMRDLAKEFCRQGHEVILLVPDHRLSVPITVTLEDEFTVVRIKTGRIKNVSKIIRAFNEMRLSKLMWKRGSSFFINHPCDLIVCYSPTIFFSTLVKELKMLWKAKSYLILRDLFPQWAVDAGLLKKGMIYRYFHYKEKQQYWVSDVIGVQSPANLTYFADKSWAKALSLEVLYNWFDLSERPVIQTTYRQKWNLENKIVFVYGGNIGLAQDIDNILQLARNLKSLPDMYFLLIGNGSEFSRIKRRIKNNAMTNISIYPAIEEKEYLGMLREFDVGIISLAKHLTTHNIPGKLLSYLQVELPVLASVNPGNDFPSILNQSDAGLVYINGDDAGFAEGAKKLAMNSQLRKTMAINGKNLLKRLFSVRKAADQILSSISSTEKESTL